MNVVQCRVCHARPIVPFLDLGRTALANSFVKPGHISPNEPKFPLRVALCESCGLVQIDEEVPPEVLFKDYIYVSGTSDLIFKHAAWLASEFTSRYGLNSSSLIVEAASNDGTVLKAFKKHGVKTIGVEPAENIAARANAEGIETVCDFFNEASARTVRAKHGPAKLFLARHVLAHVADLHGFVKGISVLLDNDGVSAVEMPYLVPFHDKLEYDTVYHEHLCYFSVRVLKTLFEKFGMELINVDEVAIHGGSIVVSAQLKGGPRAVQPSVQRMLANEEARGLHKLAPWTEFAKKVAESKAALLKELDALKAAGKRIAGYGAPAKGNTLLAYCGIGTERIDYIVDKSPYKQNFLTPGHHIPVYAPEKLLQDQPDVVLILAWNFAPEIVQQQAEYKKRGGRFLIPIPRATYI
ncbi:MAG TPA: class I SAM-dependent methyltransferase [Planctomycetota bacterium]|nr:class I SAM-dependent methyltransferase [Planctomycetota bacterium]